MRVMDNPKSRLNLVLDIGLAVVLLAGLCAASALYGGQKTTAVIVEAMIGACLPLSGYLLLSCIEHLSAPAGPRKSGRRWWLHLHINLVNMIVGIPLAGFFGAYLATFMVKHLGIELGLIDLRIDKFYGWIGVFFAGILGAAAGDFFYYWVHRAMHKSMILWQHHKMHHLDPEFDALTGLRFNWIEYVLLGVLSDLPSAILFKTDAVPLVDAGWVNGIVLYVLMMSMHINHSNLRMQFGKASPFWNSSQTHRIHHSRLLKHRDKNFAAFVPLWDVLFGTYYAPQWNEFPPTGVDEEVDIRSLWEVQIFTFREWWKMFRAWQRRRRAAV